jgi:hypothetical protein
MGQGWPQQPDPFRPDIAAQHTVRQPAVGQPTPQNPFAQPQPGYPQQGAPSPYPPGYPQQAAYPQQPGFPQQQAPYAQAPAAYPQQAYPQQAYPQQAYPQQQPGAANYAGYPAFPQQQPPMPPASVNAFPAIEQAGSGYSGPQVGGMAGHALLDHQSLPNWLAGAPGQPVGQVAPRSAAPSGMQARSLVDDQALPKWLRDQPDDAGRANVSEWIGASAAQEPMPPFLSEAYAQAQVARAPQQNGASGMSVYQANDNPLYQAPSPIRAGSGGFGDDAVMPDWLRAQAGGAGPQGAPMAFQAATGQEHAGGFAASDLIDPTALPAWVTGRAAAVQTFSSTHGWSVANPEPSFAAPEPGFAGGGAFDGAASAQSPWNDAPEAPWGADSAQDGMAYDQRDDADQQYGRGQPLAPDELPPWLRGKGGAQASGGRMASAQRNPRNPWASAGEPMEPAGGWDDAEQWDGRGAQAEQGWDDDSGWGASDDGRSDNRRDRQMSGWGHDEPSAADWGASEPQSARGGTGQRQHMGGGRDGRGRSRDQEPAHAAGAYDDDGYGAGYDQMDEEYDEEPSDHQRGRGWLGFLRRDKH